MVGDQIVSKQEEDLYIYNEILVPNFELHGQTGNNQPKVFVNTYGLNFKRSKVLATVSLEGRPQGEMLVYLLNRNEEGRIANHNFVGKAGFHITGEKTDNKVYEFKPSANDSLSEEEIVKLNISLDNVNVAVKKHVNAVQEQLFGASLGGR